NTREDRHDGCLSKSWNRTACATRLLSRRISGMVLMAMKVVSFHDHALQCRLRCVWKQHLKPPHHVSDNFRWHRTNTCYLSCPPIEAFDLIRQYDAAHAQAFWNRNFEGITFCLIRNRAKYGQADTPVVGGWRKHQDRKSVV